MRPLFEKSYKQLQCYLLSTVTRQNIIILRTEIWKIDLIIFQAIYQLNLRPVVVIGDYYEPFKQINQKKMESRRSEDKTHTKT